MARFLESQKREDSRRQFTRRTVILFCSVMLLSLVSALWLSHLKSVWVQKVVVSDAPATNSEAIATVAEAVLAEKYAWVFPKRNIFLVPEKRIAARVTDAFSRVSHTEVTVSKDRSLVISVSERVPYVLACRTTDQRTCFFVDTMGVVFDTAPNYRGRVFFTYSVDESVPLALGGLFMSEEVFRDLETLRAQVRAFDVEPTGVEINKEDARLLLREGPALVFRVHMAEELREKALQNLKLVLAQAPFLMTSSTEQFHSALRGVEYFDVRFEDRVYYKEKN